MLLRARRRPASARPCASSHLNYERSTITYNCISTSSLINAPYLSVLTLQAASGSAAQQTSSCSWCIRLRGTPLLRIAPRWRSR